MKDVKVEAEIRAALFGVETIRDLFSKSLGKTDFEVHFENKEKKRWSKLNFLLIQVMFV